MKKHLKLFNTHNEYDTYINGENKIFPNICYCINNKDIHYNPLPYSTDGLVYYFDGIKKGNDPTKWTNLVGNEYFTFNTHSSVDYNSIIMDGSGYLSGNAPMQVSADIGTIEVCAEQTNSGSAIIFFSAGTTNLSIIISSTGMCFKQTDSGHNQFNLTKSNIFTWSSTNQMCLYNGVKYTSLNNNSWVNANTSFATLGARSNNTPYYFSGKIYAIRIYNRKLTENEMKINQKLDNIRFKLNLII